MSAQTVCEDILFTTKGPPTTWSYPQPLEEESGTKFWKLFPWYVTITHSVHQDINQPSKTPLLLSCQAPLLKTALSKPRPPPLFQAIPPFLLAFRELPPSKSRIFQWTPKILKCFILNPVLSFKSHSILSKNFPVWILVYDREKHFCLETFFVIKYFRF